MSDEHAGVLTFLFTDVEGSTRGWDTEPAAMSAALASHDAALRAVFTRHSGRAFSQAGDSFAVSFHRPEDAIAAAIDGQRSLQQTGVRVRMGLHAGTAEQRDGLLFGAALNKTARVMGLGCGGQVLLSDVVHDLLPPGVAVRDLGHQRLPGFAEPERVWQLVAPDLDDDFPPLPGLRTDNLPARSTSFVGRADEQRAVTEHLTSSRIVTLLGPGGVGKTRLAVETARSLHASFPDGIRFVDLTTVAHAELVAAAVAGALGLRLGHGSDPYVALATHVENRHILVLLDNCEHVIDEAAHIARVVTAADATTRVLATSRVRLRVAGETTVAVAALDTSSPQGSAAELFLHRAEQVAPGISRDRSAPPVVVDICARLDGMPLAIELAASRVGELPLTVLRERLSDRFGLLDDTAAAREDSRVRSLRATVDWSYDLLSPPARELFEELSVFAGSFTVDAAEAVASAGSEVIGHLAELVAASLVQLRRDDVSPYRLLETFRAYGQQRLQERDRLSTARDRHVDLILARTSHLAALPYDATGVLARRTGMRAIAADVFAAIDHLTEIADLPRLRQALTDVSELCWEDRPTDVVPFLERSVVACADMHDDDSDVIRGTAALLLFFLSTGVRAGPVAGPVVARHQAAGTQAPVTALIALALATLRGGEPEVAREVANSLAVRADAAARPTERLLALAFAGWVLANLGEAERGGSLCAEAVRTDTGYTAWSIALSNLYADALTLCGRFDDAIAFCHESVEGRFDLTSYGRLQMLRILAQTHLVMRQLPESKRYLRELIAEVVDTADASMLSFVLELTAAFLVHEGEHATAARLAGAADHLRADAYLGAPLELAAREWLQRRLAQALGTAADSQRLAGIRLDRVAALALAAEALGS
ncbi:MAG: adenylate/guanylate cyclase domain-containing protein [Frankiaceae bacterium]|nr:adenylate/guanylate cyclase domain-containing protein [Frankiaceae bacterium]